MPARPFLRTSSKCHLIPSSGYESSPPFVEEVRGDPHHVVIGFHLPAERKNQLDACDSPRSVLEPSVLCVTSHSEQSRSPRSPRSVLGCLISGKQTHLPIDGGVGLGVVAAIKAEEARAIESLPNVSMKSKPVVISLENGNVDVLNQTVFEGSMVDDAPVFCGDVMRDDDFDDFDEDEPMIGIHESIFCAASPFSAGYSLEKPVIDFLSTCFHCKCQLLHSKDVYMYKGYKAFCSSECRYQQIVIDEFKERQLAAANCYMGSSIQDFRMPALASAAEV